MLKAKDFFIRQTSAKYYSVYRIVGEKSFCLRSHIMDIKKATNYIEWLIDYINTHYPDKEASNG
jgi:hypothetical protein